MKNKYKLISLCLILISSLTCIGIISNLIQRPPKNIENAFISTWDTRNTSEDSSDKFQIKLPLIRSGDYNFIANWGDGTESFVRYWDYGEVTHTYRKEGIYNITIYGKIRGWNFFKTGDKEKLLEIKQWGSLQLGNSYGYFAGCSNLVITAKDSLDLLNTSSLINCFSGCINLEKVPGMNEWDVSGVERMSGMFSGAVSFNQNISNWDVSHVRNMSNMFYDVKLSRSNYDALLLGWSKLNLRPNVTFHGGNSHYSEGAPALARQKIIDKFNWTIMDGGKFPS